MIPSEWKDLPVIDWEMGMRLAGNQIDLARDMIFMLAQTLPDELTEIERLIANNQSDDLLKRVHKLHGAVAYCGTPRLKAVLATMESRLKQGEAGQMRTLLPELKIEIEAVIKDKSTI